MLRQLNLELSFTGPGMPGKYIQYERSAVNNLDFKGFLKISLLPRRQVIIKDHRIILDLFPEAAQLIELAPANIMS